MTFQEALDSFNSARNKLFIMYDICHEEASKKIRGDWKDPDVCERRRNRASELFAEKYKNMQLKIEFIDG